MFKHIINPLKKDLLAVIWPEQIGFQAQLAIPTRSFDLLRIFGKFG
ncbi:MAG: hypothetical protein ACXVZU_06050 [Methanobacteriaceae archaeon]